MKLASLLIGILFAWDLASAAEDSIPSRYQGTYPAAASKKGLQVEMVDDALALGVKQAALNFNLSQLIAPQFDTNDPVWTVDGVDYHFKRGYVEDMDRRIKALSSQGVVVTLIVLTYQSGDAAVSRILIHPRCATNAPNHLGNFNTVTDEGRRWLTATLEFCAKRWSRPDKQFGQVAGYIMGNEVNSHWWWADFDWNIAFHPYPENLFEPRFWNDRTATTDVLTTPRITFKNIELLPAYLRRSEILYRGQPRRIILSEQGFHTPGDPDGETVQAAAFCYAYKKIERLSGIDAFILHRHVDNAGEGGLLLGLRGNQPKDGEARPKKKIYECFRVADTPDWQTTFAFALPIVGLKNWEDVTR